MATVIPVRLGKTTAYIVEGAGGCVLIDTGPTATAASILSALSRSRCENLEAVVMTHTHYDHTRALASLCSHVDVDVLVQREEAESLRAGFTPLPRGTSFLPKIIAVIGATFNANLTRYIGVEPTVVVDEALDLHGYGVGGSVIHTPGHTAGSMSVILESGEAFVGDTLFHILPGSVYPPFADRPDMLLESWRALLATDAHTFYPAHGGPIRREQFEDAARKRIPDL